MDRPGIEPLPANTGTGSIAGEKAASANRTGQFVTCFIEKRTLIKVSVESTTRECRTFVPRTLCRIGKYLGSPQQRVTSDGLLQIATADIY